MMISITKKLLSCLIRHLVRKVVLGGYHMKYLTKEWFELSQRTDLYFDLEVNEGAAVNDDELYLRLYKEKENEFVESEHKSYDLDPRYMLEEEGRTLVPLHKFINGEEITEEDTIVYHIPADEKESILKMIEEYDVRPPFDVKKYSKKYQLKLLSK